MKTKNYKIGNNLLCNILNNKIPLSWLNLTIESYKVKCKKLFLLNLVLDQVVSNTFKATLLANSLNIRQMLSLHCRVGKILLNVGVVANCLEGSDADEFVIFYFL